MTPTQDTHSPPPSKQHLYQLFILVGLLVCLIVGSFALSLRKSLTDIKLGGGSGISKFGKSEAKVEQFKSVEEFRDYLAKTSELSGGFSFGGISQLSLRNIGMVDTVGIAPSLSGLSNMEKSASPDRVSGTNVQVQGIDEPDIVKTNGKQIYLSREAFYYPFRQPIDIMPMGKMIAPTYTPRTEVLSAFPPANLASIGNIPVQGNLLLDGKRLIVFTNDNRIVGYDISKPETPTEKWKLNFQSNHYLVTSRLYKGKIYAVLASSINHREPCPIVPLDVSGTRLLVPCTDIYHPTTPTDADTTFTTVIVNTDSGSIEKSSAFVGSGGNTIVYMSENSLYVTYSYHPDLVAIMYNFFTEKAADLISADLLSKLKELNNYNLSSGAKSVELNYLLEKYKSTLDDDARIKFENDLTNRMQAFAKEHIRDLERTGIVKLDLNNLSVSSVGSVPGTPLNQFSLDEYKNNLRIATTLSGNFFSGSGDSVSDVYVLKPDLSEAGSVKDLGQTERIYSVRFIANRGFVVTFRQTDPFYVLDLSNPSNPEKTGELKIPGYSSYLHPLRDNHILGIGKEGSFVKLSLFDVSDPKNPTETSKYTTNEYWSEALNNHHAFLQDSKFESFFLPGSNGGFIFSYKNNSLSLTKAISDQNPKRALYIGDYLYIISDTKITVVNQRDGQSVKELSL